MQIYSVFQRATVNKKLFLMLFIAVTFVMTISQSGFALANEHPPRLENSIEPKTLVISVPRTTWELLEQANTPNIDKLVSRGAIAGLSVRTRTPSTSPAKAYASLSSGNRAEAPDSSISTFINPNEQWEGFNAKTLFERQRGDIGRKDVAGLGLGFEIAAGANKTSAYQARVGLLVETLEKNGHSISVIGNADYCNNEEAGCFDRSLAYFGSDSNGVLANGDISRNLLSFSKTDTTGISLNNDLVAKKVKSSMNTYSVTLVECSDLQRLEELRKTSIPSVYESQFLAALSRCDELVGKIMNDFSFEQNLVYVLSPTSPSEISQTTIFVGAGKSIPRGFATSASTRHIGSVTLVDLAPSILESYSIDIPKEMGKTPFDWEASSKSDQQRIDQLVLMNKGALARESAIGPITLVLVLLSVIAILFCILALNRGGKWVPVARFAVLLGAFYPTATYLLKPFYLSLQIPFGLIVVVLGICIIGTSLSLLIMKRFGVIHTVLFVAIYNLGVHVVDIIFFDGTLQFNSAFGHSPIIAGRFSGFSNQAFAIISISMVLIVAMVFELTKHCPEKIRKYTCFALLMFMIAVLVIDGAPFLGSDVGGILALVPTVFVVSMLIFEKKIGLKIIFASGIVTVLTLVGFALLDLTRPVSKRTHLGRFAESVVNGDAGVTVQRKLGASLRTFHSSLWVYVVITFVAFCVFLFVRHRDLLKAAFKLFPGFRIFVLSGITVGLLGMALNDSGVSIPAMMIIISMVPLTLFLEETTKELKEKS